MEIAVPPSLSAIAEALLDAGHSAHLVGASLHALLSGGRPPVYELSTDASVERVAERLPAGVPTSSRRRITTVPTPDGPVDVASRLGSIEDDLAHRDFTVHAVAYDLATLRVIDPYDGLADAERGRLRAVRSAADRLRDDPLRSLRAIRLVATEGFAADPELTAALHGTGEGLAVGPREPVRRELSKILLSPRVEEAMELLERSGIATALAPKAAPGAGPLLARLPRDLELRLAGWLIGARARRVVQSLRFSRPTVERVELLVRLHPLDAQFAADRPAALARFLRRVAPGDVRGLLALREAEMAVRGGAVEAGVTAALAAIRKGVENHVATEQRAYRRTELAATGADVMEWLCCDAGPRVGRALAYLADAIERDPSLNTRERLRALVTRWHGGA